jgi:hypothetical protein
MARRVITDNGSLVLCAWHLALCWLGYRGQWRLTPERFPARLCDRCHPEET